MKRVKVLVYGLVQGVAFRASVRNQAVLIGVRGYVKNLKTGEVEAVFEGEDEKVDDLVQYCKKGPMISKVEKVEVEEQEFKDEFKEFEIKY